MVLSERMSLRETQPCAIASALISFQRVERQEGKSGEERILESFSSIVALRCTRMDCSRVGWDMCVSFGNRRS